MLFSIQVENSMNQLSTAKRTQIIAALIEGNSINATCRTLGVGKHTILRLLEDAGCACAAFHGANVRNLRVGRAQCDEVWSFVYAKQKNVTMEQMEEGAGDCWTWTAIDADSKLIISYMLGGSWRDYGSGFHARCCFAHQQSDSANHGWASGLRWGRGECFRLGD
jgi:hypothetical protein